MFHPLIKTLATRPHLLVDHVGAYADLVAAQAGEAMQGLRERAILLAGLALAVLLASGLTGVALLMLALMPLERMHQPWLLLVVPLTPWLIAAACGWRLKARSETSLFEPVREQLAADAALLREAAKA